MSLNSIDFSDATPGTPAVLTSKTGRTIGGIVLVAALLQWMPGLEPLRWLPADLTTMLPRLFRAAPVAPVQIEGTVDDDSLLAMVPDQPPETPGLKNPVRLPPVGDDAMTMYAQAGPVSLPPDPGEEGPDDEIPPGMAEAAASFAPYDDGTASEEDPEVVTQFFQSDANLPAPPRVRTTDTGLPLLAIEDPQRSMDRFYRSLQRVQKKAPGATARVVHYGDSLITGDYVTNTMRRLLQTRFGDAGHGFVLAGKPAPWYRRENLKLETSDGWSINRMTQPTIEDGAYGLGAVTFRTTNKGEWVQMTPEGEDLNKTVSKMEVYYYAQPRGGQFQMGIDGRMIDVSTKAEKAASRKAEIQMNEGHHTFKLKTLGNGEVRLFGMVMERDGPGVVYDALGLDGARAALLKRMDPDHWHDQIRLRRPDLLVLHYGTNESQAENLGIRTYAADLSQQVGHLRAALPGVSCLLVAPMDRADKTEDGKLVTRPVVKRIVLAQRRVAYEQGCAFWNTWAAMGGEGSMAKWYKSGLGGGDLTHPTRGGARRIGSMLFAALMDGYAEYLKTHP
ncbi:MAG: hypothetical protein KC549_10405 [Myxococcales bacterium]|nr:hypothetical protein [Myxococcales bacterium]